jgi:prolyl-tRNA editing enzyme YbaK/EbsC (Cys-tRNA(Pro) deacylase)
MISSSLTTTIAKEESSFTTIDILQKYLNDIKYNTNHNIKIINDKNIKNNDDNIIVKSLIFDIGEYQYLILLDSKKSVDIKILSIYFKLNEKYITLCNKNMAEEISGLIMGQVHPITFLYKKPIPIIIDEELIQYQSFYAGSGNYDYSTCLNVNDIIKVSKMEVKIFPISCDLIKHKHNNRSKIFDKSGIINNNYVNMNVSSVASKR